MEAISRKNGRAIVEWLSVVALAWLVACGKPGEQGAIRTPSGPAKPLPAIWNALPESTVGALALTDLDRWRTDLKKTALNDMWEDPNLKTWREQSWPKFKSLLAEKTGITVEEIDGLIHGDVLVLFAVTRDSSQTEPVPHGAVLIRPSTNKAQVEAFIQKMLARVPGEKPVQKWVGDVLVLADKEPFAAEVAANLQSGRSPLESSKSFGVMKRNYASDGFAHAWINAEKLMGLIKETGGPTSRQKHDAALKNSGLNSLLAVYFSTSIHEKGFLSTLRLQCDGPRQGVLAWFGENAPSKAVRLVPGDAQAYFSMRHAGVDKILSTIHAIAKADPEFTEQEWQQAMALAGTSLGINFEADLPKMVGKELAVSMGGTVGLTMQANLYVESPDPTLLITTLERLLTAAAIQPSQAEHQGAAYKYFSVPVPMLPLQISYGKVGDFLVVSTQQTGVRSAIEALKNKRSLADNPDYVKAMAAVGGPGWSESFIGVARGVGTQVAMFGPLLMPQINQTLGTNLSFADIPNFEVVADHQMPGVSRIRSSSDAIESQRYGTFGVGMSVPTAGVLMAIAVPGFMRAREFARAVSCQENLIKIEGAVDQWAIEHDKKDGDTCTWADLVGPKLYLKETPRCPAGGHYPDKFTVGVSPTCDYRTPAWFDTEGDKFRHKVPGAAK
jgi:hypothetical protein